ncbi:glycosyltransferase family 39 protein [Corticibacterium sp. UT-5YL-CI-8]|nr:glycosyltransferase family 39 protein [Tianweitania sp. UT-5YL-CI-8]
MDRRWLGLLFLAAFVKFGILGTLVVPPWSNTDEIGHYSYVMEIARGNFLPEHGVDKMDRMATLSQFGDQGGRMNYILSHPPLYYYALAPFGFVFDKISSDPVFVLKGLRLVNSLIGALSIVLLALMARSLNLSLAASLFCAAVVGMTPMFGSLSGGLSNDIAVFAFSAAGGWCLARHLSRFDWRFELGCFASFMGATLAKSTTMPILLGIVLLLALLRIVQKRLSWQSAAVLVSATLPLFVWHLVSYLHYGSWIRLGSLKTERTLSAAEHSFRSFLGDAPVLETVMSTFYGFIWIRTQTIRIIERPVGDYLSYYAYGLAALLIVAGALLASDRRFISKNIWLYCATLTISLLACVAAWSVMAAGYLSTSLVATALTFLGVYALLNAYRLLQDGEAQTKFIIVAFAAFFCLIMVSLYNFYQVYLIHGTPRALHGRYFYSVAPMFLVAIAALIDVRRLRYVVFASFFLAFLAFESYYWNVFASGIYREFMILNGG